MKLASSKARPSAACLRWQMTTTKTHNLDIDLRKMGEIPLQLRSSTITMAFESYHLSRAAIKRNVLTPMRYSEDLHAKGLRNRDIPREMIPQNLSNQINSSWEVSRNPDNAKRLQAYSIDSSA